MTCGAPSAVMSLLERSEPSDTMAHVPLVRSSTTRTSSAPDAWTMTPAHLMPEIL